MKVINADLGAFLKRITASNGNTPASLTLLHDGKVFIVKCGEDSTRSQFLDDALDNLQEAFRRRANAMTPVREAKAERATVATPSAAPASSANKPSVCPKCNGKGYTIGNAGGMRYLSYCTCMYTFTIKVP